MKNVKNYNAFTLNEMDLPPLHPMEQKLTVTRAIERAMRSKKPVILLPSPGSGRSGVGSVAEASEDLGCTMILADCEFMTPEDISLPVGKETLTPASFLPYGNSAEPMILMFKSIDRADPQVSNLLIKLATQRSLGSYTLPENCVVVTSGNESFEVGEISSSLQDRFILATP